MTLKVFRCKQCGTTLFPARYFCPSCGGAQWDECVSTRGNVAQATVVRHRIAAQAGAEVYLASVVTDAGPVVIARLDAAAQAGDAVSLELDEANRLLARRI
ncbi:Zn-ribbon domain-containing OB-fold protein [Paraburkholderia sp. DGU8]|uniref:Zn-ribbon domain-containing OB-fold protein n=1 Tax=Paraburkholderia sp. DGU8 TaxID=3161997 RepID=UPI0034651D71